MLVQSKNYRTGLGNTIQIEVWAQGVARWLWRCMFLLWGVLGPDLVSAAPTSISGEMAAALAVNAFVDAEDAIHIRNPRFEASITSSGIAFKPQRGEHAWHWCFDSVEFTGESTRVPHGVTFVSRELTSVALHRGSIVEQYVVKAGSIEQRFVINERLSGTGNLEIRGRRVTNPGTGGRGRMRCALGWCMCTMRGARQSRPPWR